jgi:PAS domain S-box-containing protein
MQDEFKEKEELLAELVELRNRVAELEKNQKKPKRATDAQQDQLQDDFHPLQIERSLSDTAENQKLRDHLHQIVLEQRAILDTANVAISLVRDRKQVWINRKTEEMFQYPKEELVGHTTRKLYFSQEAYEQLGKEAYPVLAQGLTYETVQELVRRDGSHIWVKYNGRAVDPPDLSVGTLWVLEDITERMRMEEALKRAHEELELRVAERTEELMRVNEDLKWEIAERKRTEEERETLQAQLNQAQRMESVGRLAGGVAHDFNNMLGIILGHADLALDDIDQTQQAYADIQEIINAARRSADLVRQLLAFARKQTISPKVLDINETVQSMIKMVRRLIGEDIELLWKPGFGLWPVKIDPTQIDQILANLCVNARDAIAGVGNVIIETGNVTADDAYCRMHPGASPGEYVFIAISDDGCGMTKDVMDKLFEPFFTTKEVGKGTGLSLATVYGIVKQNNGFVDVQSVEGRGTTFRVYLPRADFPVAEVQPLQHPNKSYQGDETILLVEDETAILELAKRVLEQRGYQVLAARNPTEALSLAEGFSGQIHLLITDVIMPGMNGKEFAERLGAFKAGFRSIFMSGYTRDVIAQHGVLDEGIDFLQKPFTVKDLAQKVRKILDA